MGEDINKLLIDLIIKVDELTKAVTKKDNECSVIRPNLGIPIDTTDIVYFIGSGTSAIFGMPTFANIRSEAKNIYKNLDKKDPRKQRFAYVLKTWEEHFDDYDIEQLYSAMESLEKVHRGIPIPILIKTDEIMSVVYHTIVESSKPKIVKENKKNPFDYFARFIFDKDCRIITTNWDINIESLKNSDSKDSFLKRHMINYGGGEYGIYAYDDLSLSSGIKIIKLNGSLNWGYCENCDKIYYFNEEDYEKFILLPSDISIKRLDNQITTNLLINKQVLCKNCGKKNIEPIVIPPTLSKFVKVMKGLEYTSLDRRCLHYFTMIWRELTDYLMWCKKVYFIGYSFPITDLAIRNIVNVALKMHIHEKLEIIVITNKKYGDSRIKFENNYMAVIPRHLHKNLRFYYCGFENYDFQHDDCAE